MSAYIPNAHRGTSGHSRQSMSRSTYIWIGVGVVFLLIFVGGCSGYNSMKKSQIAVDESWGNVQSAYQRRLQLIPNLVNTVKGAAAHESEVVLGATQARTGLDPKVAKAGDDLMQAAQAAAGGNFSPDGNQGANLQSYDNVERAYKIYVNAVHEAYPTISVSQNFLGLQDELSGTENRIDHARIKYNEAVKQYNTSIGLFPKNILAGLFGFEEKQMFQADAGAMQAPDVDFSK